jgi:delta-aminolevulinic acid dehydratase/porphobilinogen synthase
MTMTDVQVTAAQIRAKCNILDAQRGHTVVAPSRSLSGGVAHADKPLHTSHFTQAATIAPAQLLHDTMVMKSPLSPAATHQTSLHSS